MKRFWHPRVLLSLLMLLQVFITGAAVVIVFRAEQLESSSNSAALVLQRLNEGGRSPDIGREQALNLLYLSLNSEVMLERAFKALVRIQLAFGVLSLATAVGVAYVLWIFRRGMPTGKV